MIARIKLLVRRVYRIPAVYAAYLLLGYYVVMPILCFPVLAFLYVYGHIPNRKIDRKIEEMVRATK